MNNRVHINLGNNKTLAAEENYLFSGILVMSACCLCCIGGTGGHFFCI